MTHTESPISILGMLGVGEANATAGDLRKKICGSQWPYFVLAAVSVGASTLAGSVVADLLNVNSLAGIIIGASLGYLIYFRAVRPLSVRRFRKRFEDRQQPLNLPVTLTINGEKLVYEIGDVTHAAKWPCVTEIFKSHGYWIFIAQGDAFYAPQRCFNTPDDERSFLRAALSRMSEGAKGRSREAMSFCAAAS